MSFSGRILLSVLIRFSSHWLLSQTYLYFQDSKIEDYYEFSCMELTAPSALERKGYELRKFPVETQISPHKGINCLKLSWKSVAGGDWVAIAAGNNWQEHDISNTDTLSFWLFSSIYVVKLYINDTLSEIEKIIICDSLKE